MRVCVSLCTTVIHSTAQNSSDNFPSYPPDNHHIHSSDDVYWMGGGRSCFERSFFMTSGRRRRRREGKWWEVKVRKGRRGRGRYAAALYGQFNHCIPRTLCTWSQRSVVVMVLGRINEVTLHWTRLVLGRVTVFEQANHLSVQPATQANSASYPQ